MVFLLLRDATIQLLERYFLKSFDSIKVY